MKIKGVKMRADKFIEYANTYQHNIPFTQILRERWEKRYAAHFLYTFTFALHRHRTCIYSPFFVAHSTKILIIKYFDRLFVLIRC